MPVSFRHTLLNAVNSMDNNELLAFGDVLSQHFGIKYTIPSNEVAAALSLLTISEFNMATTEAIKELVTAVKQFDENPNSNIETLGTLKPAIDEYNNKSLVAKQHILTIIKSKLNPSLENLEELSNTIDQIAELNIYKAGIFHPKILNKNLVIQVKDIPVLNHYVTEKIVMAMLSSSLPDLQHLDPTLNDFQAHETKKILFSNILSKIDQEQKFFLKEEIFAQQKILEKIFYKQKSSDLNLYFTQYPITRADQVKIKYDRFYLHIHNQIINNINHIVKIIAEDVATKHLKYVENKYYITESSYPVIYEKIGKLIRISIRNVHISGKNNLYNLIYQYSTQFLKMFNRYFIDIFPEFINNLSLREIKYDLKKAFLSSDLNLKERNIDEFINKLIAESLIEAKKHFRSLIFNQLSTSLEMNKCSFNDKIFWFGIDWHEEMIDHILTSGFVPKDALIGNFTFNEDLKFSGLNKHRVGYFLNDNVHIACDHASNYSADIRRDGKPFKGLVIGVVPTEAIEIIDDSNAHNIDNPHKLYMPYINVEDIYCIAVIEPVLHGTEKKGYYIPDEKDFWQVNKVRYNHECRLSASTNLQMSDQVSGFLISEPIIMNHKALSTTVKDGSNALANIQLTPESLNIISNFLSNFKGASINEADIYLNQYSDKEALAKSFKELYIVEEELKELLITYKHANIAVDKFIHSLYLIAQPENHNKNFNHDLMMLENGLNGFELPPPSSQNAIPPFKLQTRISRMQQHISSSQSN